MGCDTSSLSCSPPANLLLSRLLNLLQSVQLPFALIPVLAFNASPRLMGRFVNGTAMIGLTLATALATMLVNVSGVLAFADAALDGAGTAAWGNLAAGVIAYLLAVMYVLLAATSAAGLLPTRWSRLCAAGSSGADMPLLAAVGGEAGGLASLESAGERVDAGGATLA